MESELSPEYWITYGFCGCYVRYYPATQFTETLYPDGTHVPAAPSNSEAYCKTAQQLGYGDDLAACCREHEILHTFLAEAQGLPHSEVMWALAHDIEASVPLWQREYEEFVVLEFQRYLNGNEPHQLDLPPHLLSLRDNALQLLRPGNSAP